MAPIEVLRVHRRRPPGKTETEETGKIRDGDPERSGSYRLTA